MSQFLRPNLFALQKIHLGESVLQTDTTQDSQLVLWLHTKLLFL